MKIMNIVPPLNIQKKDIRLKSMTLKGNLMIMSYMLSTKKHIFIIKHKFYPQKNT